MGIPTLLLISLHWFQESRRARQQTMCKTAMAKHAGDG